MTGFQIKAYWTTELTWKVARQTMGLAVDRSARLYQRARKAANRSMNWKNWAGEPIICDRRFLRPGTFDT